jgi:hypothetical protein
MDFAMTVLSHIEHYTVPQYGDFPNDQVTPWTSGDCKKQIAKYVARFGSNQRGCEDEMRDLLKIAHYAALAYNKLITESEV